jgi:hypothetical protein
MSKLFLLKEAVDTINAAQFKNGILELIAIEKKPDHIFYRHESIYCLGIIENYIFQNYGQEEQEIIRFIEQMSPYEYHCYINTEEDANAYCKSKFNGFLGFINVQSINFKKQIANNKKYKEWCFEYSDNKEYLLTKTDILPSAKKAHFAHHHGEKELSDFWKKIKNSPYVESACSANFGSEGKEFIRKVKPNGDIEIVLKKTSKEYALILKTTGKDIIETKTIAEILEAEYK